MLRRASGSAEGVDASVVVLSYPNRDENADVEQGSAVAISTASQTRFRGYGFGSRSNLAREWISRWGLASLWSMLEGGTQAEACSQ